MLLVNRKHFKDYVYDIHKLNSIDQLKARFRLDYILDSKAPSLARILSISPKEDLKRWTHDPRSGPLSEDPEYLKFLEELKHHTETVNEIVSRL